MNIAGQKNQHPIWSALRANSGGFIVFGVLTFFLTCLKFLTPIYMLLLYNRVVPAQEQGMDTLIALSIAFPVFLLFFGFIEYARTRILNLFARYVDQELAAASFSAVFRSHVTGIAPEGASKGSQGLRDLDTIRRFWSQGGVASYFDAIFSPIMIGALYILHPALFFLGLAGAVVIFSIALITEFASRSAMRASAEAEAAGNRLSESSLQNAEVVTALGMLERLRSRWSQVHDKATDVGVGSGSLVGAFVSTARTIRMVLQMAVLGLGAYLFISGEMAGAGGIVAASIILGQGLNPIDQSISSWRQFVAARQASARLGKLVAAAPGEAYATSLPRPQAVVQAQGLNLVIPGQRRPLFTGVNFRLKAGDVMVILGASGSGKSSLMRVLSGLWPAGGGSVTLGGTDLHNWDSQDRGQYIGYLPQDVQLLPGTVRETISRLTDADDSSIIEAAKRAGCHDMILGLPNAYDTVIGGAANSGDIHAVNLSGGQRQRLGLARALFGSPPLILLDEPNSNLDDVGVESLKETIKDLSSQGHIVVVITHAQDMIRVSNKLMVLRDSDVVFGPTEKVIAELQKPGRSAKRAPASAPASTTGSLAQGQQAGTSTTGGTANATAARPVVAQISEPSAALKQAVAGTGPTAQALPPAEPSESSAMQAAERMTARERRNLAKKQHETNTGETPEAKPIDGPETGTDTKAEDTATSPNADAKAGEVSDPNQPELKPAKNPQPEDKA